MSRRGNIFTVPSIVLPPPAPSGASTFTAVAGEPIPDGSLVYISANGTVKIADRTVPGKEFAAGVKIAGIVIVTVQQDNLVNLRMEDGLILGPDQMIFLSTGGRGTNVPPGTPAVHMKVGSSFDVSGYTGINSTAVVLLSICDQPLFVEL
jgi:hypothetical protein